MREKKTVTASKGLHDRLGRHIPTLLSLHAESALVTSGAFLGLCVKIANWRESDGHALLDDYLQDLDAASPITRAGADRLFWPRDFRRLFAEFVADPAGFSARRRPSTVRHLKEIAVGTSLLVNTDGQLVHLTSYRAKTRAALMDLCAVFLADPYTGLPADLKRCALEGCGRFFWRHKTKRIYCSDACSEAADNQLAGDRVRAWRERQKKAAKKAR
jgi:hypothetical protein